MHEIINACCQNSVFQYLPMIKSIINISNKKIFKWIKNIIKGYIKTQTKIENVH